MDQVVIGASKYQSSKYQGQRGTKPTSIVGNEVKDQHHSAADSANYKFKPKTLTGSAQKVSATKQAQRKGSLNNRPNYQSIGIGKPVPVQSRRVNVDQSKLKPKRAVVVAQAPRGFNSTFNNQMSYLKQSQQLNEARVATKKTTKSTVKRASGGTSGYTQKISKVQESSFNNVTIKSFDKYNSTLGPSKPSQINPSMHPLSAKHAKKKKLNAFSVSNTAPVAKKVAVEAAYHSQKSQQPQSKVEDRTVSANYKTVGGASASFHKPQHYHHSKNASISGISATSNNSRFTFTRPKNPTECSSVSSKGSIDSVNSRGLSIGGRLKNGKSFNQTSTVQCVSVKISDSVKDSLSPTKSYSKATTGGAGYNPLMSNANSKFSLMNRSAIQQQQFSQSNLKSILSPKSTQSAHTLNSINQQMVLKSSSKGASRQVAPIESHKSAAGALQQQNKRKLTLKLSASQLHSPHNLMGSVSASNAYASKASVSSEQRALTKGSVHQKPPQNGQLNKTASTKTFTKAALSQSNSFKVVKPIKTNVSVPALNLEQSSKAMATQATSQANKDVLSNDAIIEEQVEDSAQNTKRQSLENQKTSNTHSSKSKNKPSHNCTLSSQEAKVKTKCLNQDAAPSQTIQNKAQNLSTSVSQKQLVKALNLVLSQNKSTQNVNNTSVDTKLQSSSCNCNVSCGSQVNQSKELQVNQSVKSEGGLQFQKLIAQQVDCSQSNNKQITSLKHQLKVQIQKQQNYKEGPEAAYPHSPKNQQRTYNSNPQQPSSSLSGVDQFPMSSRQALLLYSNPQSDKSALTDYEKVEIQNYSEVYYLGLSAKKIKGSTLNQHNFGYDDERGDYNVVTKDHLAYRYEVVEPLGSGSFGQALKCFDHKTQSMVAIKVVRNKKKFQYQAGVELKILTYLKEKDKNDDNNIVRIIDFEIFRKHLLISFELLSMNLYEFIKSNNFQGVSLGLIRRFAIQILQALKFQRDQNVVHCDLKPENILLKQPNKSGIKIIDYGSSCFQNQRIYTYIQSRFYRAPEIILGIPYTAAIDMWSFGCIMAELYTGYPLFPGESEAEQLAYVMEILGIPEDYILELSSRRNLFFEKDSCEPIPVTNSRGKRRKPNTKTLKGVLHRCQDEKFLDFISLCLDWDPVNRLSPLQALQHPWILEGLPEKVLIHHQRMFSGKDDKSSLKQACLTSIQGFPQDSESKSIQDIVDELKRSKSSKQLSPKSSKKVLSSVLQSRKGSTSSKKKLSPRSVKKAQDTKKVQLQNFVQETVNNKPKESSTSNMFNAIEISKKKQLTIEIESGEEGPEEAFESADEAEVISKGNFKNEQQETEIQNFSLSSKLSGRSSKRNPIKKHEQSPSKQDSGSFGSEGFDMPEEDEGPRHFAAHTQKIPISLIKQQEKAAVSYQSLNTHQRNSELPSNTATQTFETQSQRPSISTHHEALAALSSTHQTVSNINDALSGHIKLKQGVGSSNMTSLKASAKVSDVDSQKESPSKNTFMPIQHKAPRLNNYLTQAKQAKQVAGKSSAPGKTLNANSFNVPPNKPNYLNTASFSSQQYQVASYMTNRSYQRAVPPKGGNDPEPDQDLAGNLSSFDSGGYYGGPSFKAVQMHNKQGN